jgi:hypothetical protein
MLQERSQFIARRIDAQPANALQKVKKEHSEMAIQWFPGHMHLTKKAISERIKEIDVVIELLDARLPGSSANPMLAELTGAKPALKVLRTWPTRPAPRSGWPTTTACPARGPLGWTPA